MEARQNLALFNNNYNFFFSFFLSVQKPSIICNNSRLGDFTKRLKYVFVLPVFDLGPPNSKLWML